MAVIGFDIERWEGVPVVRAREDIDAANARRVQAELSASVEDGPATLVLDLAETRYLDSAGVDMLFRFNDRLRQRRIELILVIPVESPLTRLATIVDLAGSMPVCSTIEEALRVRRDQQGSGASSR
jgi:anti-anti-sigma factor